MPEELNRNAYARDHRNVMACAVSTRTSPPPCLVSTPGHITVVTTIWNDRTGQAGFEEEHQRCHSPKAPEPLQLVWSTSWYVVVPLVAGRAAMEPLTKARLALRLVSARVVVLTHMYRHLADDHGLSTNLEHHTLHLQTCPIRRSCRPWKKRLHGSSRKLTGKMKSSRMLRTCSQA